MCDWSLLTHKKLFGQDSHLQDDVNNDHEDDQNHKNYKNYQVDHDGDNDNGDYAAAFNMMIQPEIGFKLFINGMTSMFGKEFMFQIQGLSDQDIWVSGQPGEKVNIQISRQRKTKDSFI